MNWIYLSPWNTRVIAAIALALLALATCRWWRERRGGAPLFLRALIVGALVFVLLNPQSLLPRERMGKRKLVVLVDTSASMATRDSAGESRLGSAVSKLSDAAVLAALNKAFTLDFRQFDREERPVDSWARLASNAPAGDASDIGKAVMAVVSELGDFKAQAGVLLVSDGRATAPDALDAAQLALARSVPLWTWTLGGRVPRRDLWMETASAEALAFSGAEVELTATLHADGYPNRSFKVDLLKEDKCARRRKSCRTATAWRALPCA